MTKQLGTLLVAGALIWVVLAYPAFRLGGVEGLVYSLTAACLCLVQTALTLLWTTKTLEGTPDQQLAAVLGGTGVRIGVVAGAALGLYYGVEYFKQESFLIWLLVFYVLTLALEVGLFLRSRSATAPQPIRTPQ